MDRPIQRVGGWEKSMKKSFVLYNDYRKHISLLSESDKGKLLDAIFAYADGEEVELEGPVGMAFSFIRSQMDRDAAKWEEERQARSEAGKKGMASRWKKQKAITKDNSVIPVITNDNKALQDITKITVNENVNVNVNENVKDIVNYQEIVDLYNNTCVSLPRVTALSDQRKKCIRARLKKYSVDDIKKAFVIAEGSDFLKGANNRNWSANFDWIMNDTNLAKVLDGNYANKGNKIEMDPNFRSFLRSNEVVDFGNMGG